MCDRSNHDPSGWRFARRFGRLQRRAPLSDCAALDQCIDLDRPHPQPVAEDFRRVLSGMRRRTGHRWHRSRKSRCRSRLHVPSHVDERATFLIVRVHNGFIHRQNRRKAGIASIENLAPFIAGLGGKYRGDALLVGGPLATVHLMRQILCAQPREGQQFRIELRLDRSSPRR